MAANPLEPDPVEMQTMGRQAVDFAADFVAGLPQAPAVNAAGAQPLVEHLLRPPGDKPGEFGALLDTFGQAASAAVETAGPGYLAYVPGGGQVTSALAELLARTVNRYTGLSELAPALVAMEHGVLRWMCDQFGLPAGAGGIVTTGGSMATLAAVVAARHNRLGEGFAHGTLYVTEHTHHCVAKAARIAGLPAANIRTVPTTEHLRMDVDAAVRMIRDDRAAGLKPFLLAGTAGTTDTGSIDPLTALAGLARHEGMWFHVDAAYGGFFQLTGRGRERFSGVEAADSLVLDPHKGLFLPYGTGLLLVRDPVALRAAHGGEGNYLQDLEGSRALPDYAELGPELTREFRGLRLWLPLHLHGVGAFRDALDEKLDLTMRAYRKLAADPALEVPWEPELSVVAFRLRDGDGNDDSANQRLLERINASNRIFVSSTRVNGHYVLRLCILSLRTHDEHITEALDIIHGAARAG